MDFGVIDSELESFLFYNPRKMIKKMILLICVLAVVTTAVYAANTQFNDETVLAVDSDKGGRSDEAKFLSVLAIIGELENTDLDFSVKSALGMAVTGMNLLPETQDIDDYMDLYCFGVDSLVAVESKDLPAGYSVYECVNDIMYGGGFYVNQKYKGGMPNSGEVLEIDAWYGPFAPVMPFLGN